MESILLAGQIKDLSLLGLRHYPAVNFKFLGMSFLLGRRIILRLLYLFYSAFTVLWKLGLKGGGRIPAKIQGWGWEIKDPRPDKSLRQLQAVPRSNVSSRELRLKTNKQKEREEQRKGGKTKVQHKP